MNSTALQRTAKKLLSKGKGILAADESLPTIRKRFSMVGVKSSKETRRAYREIIFSSPGLEKYISGIILFDETIRQKTSGGVPFPQLIASKKIIPGIKVDKGAKPQHRFGGQRITEGLKQLPQRLESYKKLGAVFAKWRAVFTAEDNYPTASAIKENVKRMADYAVICQNNSVVPIVEPEVLMEGKHSLKQSYSALSKVLDSLFNELVKKGIILEGLILKTNMILPGTASHQAVDNNTIAQQTVRCFQEHVPAKTAGITLLSGGQTAAQAIARLNAIAKLRQNLPWPLTFSFGRALQQDALKIWAHHPRNIKQIQQAILKRSQESSLASLGKLPL